MIRLHGLVGGPVGAGLPLHRGSTNVAPRGSYLHAAPESQIVEMNEGKYTLTADATMAVLQADELPTTITTGNETTEVRGE